MPRSRRPLHAALRAACLGLLLAHGLAWSGEATVPPACDCAVAAPKLGIEVLLEERLDLLRGKRVGVLISGGNVDIERFAALLA